MIFLNANEIIHHTIQFGKWRGEQVTPLTFRKSPARQDKFTEATFPARQ